MPARYCEKCRGTKDEKNFYRSNNLEKYPDNGYINICRDCLTRHIDNFDPTTYLGILEELDVPYIPEQWNQLLSKYKDTPEKLKGSSILGRYLAKMRLKQYRDYRWKDNDFLRELQESRLREVMTNQGYDPSDIAKTISKIQQNNELPENYAPVNYDPEPMLPPQRPEDSWSMEEEIPVDLTEEDKQYLRLKWGQTYRPHEWVQLETLYTDMMNSYDIQTAGHKDNLKLVCKASLKANQLLDLGDIDAAQKATRMYDTLMKQGNFTAAQNKVEKGNFVDSIGELVALCEQQGFIPRYHTDGPQDQIDQIILDMQHYTRQLVTEELGLGNLIESAVKNIERERETIAEAASAEEVDENKAEMSALFTYDQEIMTLEDIDEYSDFLLEQEAADAKVYDDLEG